MRQALMFPTSMITSRAEHAVALKIGSTRRYETPINPKEVYDGFVAPQSFCYWVEAPETVG
jgi:predicted transcriptional regulator